MPDPYQEEIDRLAKLLFGLTQKKRYSIRALEKKMGVATSRFRVALKKPGALNLKMLLMVLKALEISPGEFFRMAYPQEASPEGPGLFESTSPDESEQRKALRRLLGEIVLEALTEKAVPQPPKDKV